MQQLWGEVSVTEDKLHFACQLHHYQVDATGQVTKSVCPAAEVVKKVKLTLAAVLKQHRYPHSLAEKHLWLFSKMGEQIMPAVSEEQ